jgi:hypothetical protein
MIDSDKLAGILYTEYCEMVGGKSFDNKPLPTWEAFSSDPSKQKQSNAWKGVGKTAITLVLLNYTKECSERSGAEEGS